MRLLVPRADGLGGKEACHRLRGCRTMRKSGEVERTEFPAIRTGTAGAADWAGGHDFNGGLSEDRPSAAGAKANDGRHRGLSARLGRALAAGRKRSRIWLTI